MSIGILNIFASSPFSGLQKHMAKVQGCVSSLVMYFSLVYEGDWEQAALQQRAISNLEREADEIKRDIRLNLPTSLFMPVSRGDILQLLTTQDKIANRAKDVSGLVLGRQMNFPVEIREDYLKMIRDCVKMTRIGQHAINTFDELIETGFKGHEVQEVLNKILEIDKIEHQIDEYQVRIRSELFKIEKSLDPVDAVFLYKAVDWTGQVSDRAQKLGHCLHIMLAN